MPGTNFSTAVPALVNCAVPTRLMSVQYFAEALQKLTCPAVTTLPLAFTVAVSATTLPEGTEETRAPSEVTARVVAVGDAFAAACPARANRDSRMTVYTRSVRSFMNFSRFRPEPSVACKRITSLLAFPTIAIAGSNFIEIWGDLRAIDLRAIRGQSDQPFFFSSSAQRS